MTEVHDFLGDDPRSFGEMGDDLEKVDLVDVYGANMVIHGYKLLDSEFSNDTYVIIDAELEDGQHVILRTGGKAVKDQLNKNVENLPFRASMVEKISKRNSKPYPSFVTVG